MGYFRLRVWGSLCLLGLLLGLAPALAQAPAAPAKPAAVERLTHLAKLWGAVRYLHPYLAYRDIDWDAALLHAIPAVRSAETPEQYAAAVQTMLAALGDPATHVQKDAVRPVLPPAEHDLFRWLDEGTLFIYLRPDVDSWGEAKLSQALAALPQEIARARAVILDLRGMGQRIRPEFVLNNFADLLASRPATAPAQRYVFHSGYRTQLGVSSGGYYSGFLLLAANRFAPPAGAPPKRVVFLVNGDTAIPPVAAALQAAGDGAIVSEGKISEEGLVEQRTVDLGEGLQAFVRLTEAVPQAGWPGLRADAEVPPVPAAGADPAFEAARRLVRDGWPAPPATPAVALPEAVFRRDPRYETMTEPTLEYRLLAVFRFWNIIHFFFPYLHLTGDWDAVLPEFIARVERTRDGREYALAMAEMGTRTHDGHTSLTGNPTLDQFYGEAPAPIAIRWIENAWVVVAVGSDPAVRAAGAEAGDVGDVVLTLDGRPVAEREALLRRHLAASTEAGMRRKIADRLLSGPTGSTAVLTLRGRGDRVKEVRLTRGPWTPPATGETVRVLPGNLGYVDLNRLTVPEVDAMFERLKDTRAIIFDMRGYPNGTAWSIAPRLNTRGAVYAALFRRRMISGREDEQEQTGFDFSQPLPTSESWKYTGRTVMLIDERTVSQAEHTGLFFETANGTKFIGTPTAGANGDVTYFSLPGIASVRFTGHDVRHADGRQLQRIGLVPDVEAAPTIRGIREGRDEVLDRAVQFLNQEPSRQAHPRQPEGAP